MEGGVALAACTVTLRSRLDARKFGFIVCTPEGCTGETILVHLSAVYYLRNYSKILNEISCQQSILKVIVHLSAMFYFRNY